MFICRADYYFDFGVTNVSEEFFTLHKSVHVGNFQDSVLISHEQEVLVRYFPYGVNNLAFYESLYQEPIDMPKGTRLGFLKNTGDMSLNIRFIWGNALRLSRVRSLRCVIPKQAASTYSLLMKQINILQCRSKREYHYSHSRYVLENSNEIRSFKTKKCIWMQKSFAEVNVV